MDGISWKGCEGMDSCEESTQSRHLGFLSRDRFCSVQMLFLLAPDTQLRSPLVGAEPPRRHRGLRPPPGHARGPGARLGPAGLLRAAPAERGPLPEAAPPARERHGLRPGALPRGVRAGVPAQPRPARRAPPHGRARGDVRCGRGPSPRGAREIVSGRGGCRRVARREARAVPGAG